MDLKNRFSDIADIVSGRPRIALLTQGGDCAGLNAAIQTVVLQCAQLGWDVIGIEKGVTGLLEQSFRLLRPNDVKGWDCLGGTLLLSTREKYGDEHTARMIANFRALGCKALIATGGDGSLKNLLVLAQKGKIDLIGIPKTVDFDIGLTDRCIGHDTAVHMVVETLTNVAGTAVSHQRIMVVETMGRDRGWIALRSAIKGEVDAVIIPEIDYDIGQIAKHLVARREEHGYAFLVVAEGARTPDNQQVKHPHGASQALGGIAHILGQAIDEITGLNACAVEIVKYTQRGAPPIESDRRLAIDMATHAVRYVQQGLSGVMVAAHRGGFRPVPISDALAHKHVIDPTHPLIQEARDGGIFLHNEIAPTHRMTDCPIRRNGSPIVVAPRAAAIA